MQEAGVQGALIVQPINYKFDHRYVLNAIKSYPDKFKGMMLFDPSFDDPELAVQRLDELVLDGFVGVRFNPYLFPNNEKMSSNRSAMAVFERCGELNIPVGIMCFKGIDLHHEDILELCKASPKTHVILDHFGFAAVDNQKQFDLVIDLAKYNVSVKISALFRLGDEYPYERIKNERFQPLLETFGADRMMFGTDFPYVLQEEQIGYKGAVEVVTSWLSHTNSNYGSGTISSGGGGDGDDDCTYCCSEEDRIAIMGGTAERLFGAW